MPLYESVFLASQDLAPEKVEELSRRCAAVLTEHGGRVVGEEYWGLRTLAFPMRKSNKAHYKLLKLDAPAAAVAEMERRMRFDDDVLRSLTVRVREHSTELSPLAKKREGDQEAGRRGNEGRGGRRRRDEGGGRGAARADKSDAPKADKPEAKAETTADAPDEAKPESSGNAKPDSSGEAPDAAGADAASDGGGNEGKGEDAS